MFLDLQVPHLLSNKARKGAGPRVTIFRRAFKWQHPPTTCNSLDVKHVNGKRLLSATKEQHGLRIASAGLGVEDQRAGAVGAIANRNERLLQPVELSLKTRFPRRVLAASWHQRHVTSKIPAAMMILREKMQGLPCTLTDRWCRSLAEGSGAREG